MPNKIQILGGSARGRRLASPDGLATRPALARLRNSLFNILGQTVNGQKVLDLFAGTGSLGLEALSRGADFCLFVEYNKKCLEIIKQNIANLQFQSGALAVWLDGLKIIPYALEQNYCFDLVFIDPPYRMLDDRILKEKLINVLEEMGRQSVLKPAGRIIVEHRRGQIKPADFVNLTSYDYREYGQTVLTFLRT
ncbi:MAG: 16S rRNA (guanine(966)-N(2))-methyltransferase RsmD [Planctomycetota bacterium]